MPDESRSAMLVRELRALAQEAGPGAQLPSSRELVQRFSVSPVTVVRAIGVLAAEGVVQARPGQGTFVAGEKAARAQADTSWQSLAMPVQDVGPMPFELPPVDDVTDTISLAGGYAHPSLQPVSALGAALARAGRRPGAWDRSPPPGIEALRGIFAEQIGGGVTARDVLVTSGGQASLSLIFRALAAPGSTVLVENTTYPGALAALRYTGARVQPVPLDGDGLRPDLLAEAFSITGSRMLYCQPTLNNPSGRALAPHRRREVLEVARTAGAFVVEDDFARHLAHGRDVLPPPLIVDDDHGSVIYLSSLTKPTAPSFRVGVIGARGPAFRRLEAVRHVDEFFVSRALQEAAVDLLSSPAWSRHVKAMAGALAERRNELVTELRLKLPGWDLDDVPRSGFHLWLRLPDGREDHLVADAARRAGLMVTPGSPFFAGPPDRGYLRLNFAAPAPERVRDAVQRLQDSAGY